MEKQVVPAAPPAHIYDVHKYLLGLARKGKKSKTKCQQRKPRNFRPSRYDFAVPLGYTIRQCSKRKFILTGRDKAELIDLKHRTISTIEPDSKIGRRFAVKK